MEWKPANRDRFSPAYDKGAGAVLTLPTEDGGEENHAMVVIGSEDVDRVTYKIYSHVLAKYLSGIDLEGSTRRLDILRGVTDSFERHVGKDKFRLWIYHPMYNINTCWCIKITLLSDIRTFMKIIEGEVERRSIITCDTADLLAVLDTNAESEVGEHADMGN